MKRTNVVLDEQLLEEALKVTGERTYSAVLNKALSELVRQGKFRENLKRMQALAGEDFFFPGYLEQIRPNAYSVLKEKRPAAHEVRAPRKKKSGTRRAAR
ncbi:MAG TPA: type II toxin-antitoxin system VapB family antitoxin [Thermoanaerobaculia bacterium]|nr:type II toxin-antitoxin system VapB family antitoxin [Thermoanaerobaculia bacterium]